MPDFCAPRSALDRVWELRPAPATPSEDIVLRSGDIVPAAVADIVVRRGVSDVAAFMEPSLGVFMPDPLSLTDMDVGVTRFCRAVEAGERVAVFGDYDVDGATSTALIVRWMRQAGCGETLFYIPQRLEEGYGPNAPAMDYLKAEGASLVVCVDSGTGAIDPDPAKGYDPLGHAKAIGLDVIVLDHHDPREDGLMPAVTVVNPKRPEDDGSLAYLCAAGLTFLFLVAVNRALRQNGWFARTGRVEPDLRPLLGLVALGTVADMMPLRGLNRAYVKLGLSQMGENPGLRALSDANATAKGSAEFTAHSCGFTFGPCINAGGRIDDTMLGSRLLTTDDPSEARAIAAKLVEINRERQQMQREMVEESLKIAEERCGNGRVVVLYNPDWHPGVVGLVANKVKDNFDRTAVIIGEGGKGSGRSVEGFNIGQAFHKAIDIGLLKKGGGHAAAGGLTIDPAKVDAFHAFLETSSEGLERPPTRVDLILPIEDAGLHYDAIQAFDHMAPFGMGNPRPRVVVSGGILERVQLRSKGALAARLVTADRKHSVKLILFGGDGTVLGEALKAAEGRRVDVLGEVKLDYYAGTTSVEVRLSDIMVA